MFVFFTVAFNVVGATEAESQEQSITPLQSFSHVVFVEELTATWCGYCPNAMEALWNIYESKDYENEFFYVAMIIDVNDKASQRANDDYNYGGTPTVEFDGGYITEVGAGDPDSAEAEYRPDIESCGGRTVPSLEIEVTAFDQGSATMEISVNVTNLAGEEYGGHIRTYITEITSRYKNSKNDPYHFGFLDYAFDEDIVIPTDGYWGDTVEWNGAEHQDSNGNDFGDINPANIMIITAVFNDDPNPKVTPDQFIAYYVDQTAVTTLTPPPNYGVEITPPSQSETVVEGETAVFHINVENTGDVEDEYSLAVSGPQSSWATLSHTTITVLPGVTQQITLYVDVPPGTANGNYDISVTATSVNDPQATSTALTTTIVDTPPVHGVILTCGDPTHTVLPGESTTYDISVQNTGNVDDTVDMTLSGPNSGWATLSQASVYLQPSETTTVILTVDVPADTAPGDYTMDVRGTSQGDPLESSVITTTTTVEPFVYDVSLGCAQPSQSAQPGESVVYTITVQNNGNTLDTIDLTSSGPYSHWGTLSHTSIELGSGSSQDITLTVDIPSDAMADEYMITVRGTSQGDITVFSEVTTQTTVEPVYGVDLYAGQTGDHGLPGESITYTITVTNTGNIEDTIDLSLSGDYTDWGSLSHMSIVLAAGSSQDIELTVEIPPDTVVGDYEIEVTGASRGDISVSDSLVTVTTVDPVFAVSLTCAENQLTARPGLTAVYNITVANPGNTQDTVDITMVGAYGHWGTTEQTSVYLEPDSSEEITVSILVPSDAAGGEYHVAVRGTSQGDPSVSHETDTVTTVIPWHYEVALHPQETYLTGLPGDSLVYTITVESRGEIEDTIELTVSGSAGPWPALGANAVTLEPGNTLDVTVTVEIPAETDSAEYLFVIRGTSQGDGSVFNETELTVFVEPYTYGVALEPEVQEDTVYPGESTDYIVSVENTGNIAEEIILEVTGTYTAWLQLSTDSLNLDAGTEHQVIISIEIPVDAQAKSYHFRLKGTCSQDSGVSDTSDIKLTVMDTEDEPVDDISISDIFHSPLNPTDVDEISVGVTVTGDGIAKVSLVYSTSEVDTVSVAMHEQTPDQYSATIGPLVPGSYNYRILVRDDSGNEMESGPHTITVSQAQPEEIDSDGDGVDDPVDVFPSDGTQWEDTDGDGFGDNPNGNDPDHYPYDQTRWLSTEDKDQTSLWDDSQWLLLIFIIIIILAACLLLFMSRQRTV